MNGSRHEPSEVLTAVRDAGGSLSPVWAPSTERGFAYEAAGVAIDERALESLAESDHLEQIFTDRISRCPSCRSHLLNMREVCVACKSPNIQATELLCHYRCGYVAPAEEFTAEADGRRCPKCYGMLRDRGTDHDVPGPQFTCHTCDRTFQLPEIAAVCLQCGRKVAGSDLERIIYEDVYAYKLSSHGASALRDGSPTADD